MANVEWVSSTKSSCVKKHGTEVSLSLEPQGQGTRELLEVGGDYRAELLGQWWKEGNTGASPNPPSFPCYPSGVCKVNKHLPSAEPTTCLVVPEHGSDLALVERRERAHVSGGVSSGLHILCLSLSLSNTPDRRVWNHSTGKAQRHDSELISGYLGTHLFLKTITGLNLWCERQTKANCPPDVISSLPTVKEQSSKPPHLSCVSLLHGVRQRAGE